MFHDLFPPFMSKQFRHFSVYLGGVKENGAEIFLILSNGNSRHFLFDGREEALQRVGWGELGAIFRD